MSALLDKSLDEIVSSNKKNNANKNSRRGARRSTGARPAAVAPAGGVQKNSKAARQPASKNQVKPTQAKPAPVNSDSKVIVSNLPKDVSEQQIKEYFAQTVGPIKRVEISYGPNSQSRGIANVTFSKSDGASKAFKNLNGLLVDGRAIKIEIVVGAAQASKVIPPVKSLAERATLPKNNKTQPKSAAADKTKKQEKPKVNDKNTTSANANTGKGRSQRRRSRNPNVRPKKTEAELDSEMADYYNNAPAAGAEAAPAANDTAMDDNIM
ncbi:mRNA export protein mlo3 [Ceratocystis fimbriata CBS 114723]|uniref:mRNA export protein mlo3 n=1 Tax=Ceratocystis fimbriata CBS 114723 TaxID=1035309 RepID=A0A2C5WXZ9_9PEZI|nr:mRNA export protein mlo3 [Ceratocystis fimbriata CBS 114723]